MEDVLIIPLKKGFYMKKVSMYLIFILIIISGCDYHTIQKKKNGSKEDLLYSFRYDQSKIIVNEISPSSNGKGAIEAGSFDYQGNRQYFNFNILTGNLIRDEWFFQDFDEKGGLILYKIFFSKNGKLSLKDYSRTTKEGGYSIKSSLAVSDQVPHLTDLTPGGKKLYYYPGYLYDYESGIIDKSPAQFFDKRFSASSDDSFPIPVGFKAAGDDVFLVQAILLINKNEIDKSSLYYGGIDKNVVMLYSNREQKILWKGSFGYSPFGINMGGFEKATSPLALSSDGNKAAFLIRMKGTSPEDPFPLYLSVLNLKTKQFENVLEIPWGIEKGGLFYQRIFLKWNPRNDSNLIVLGASEKDRIYLIDVTKKKIIKEWNNQIRSIRWSPEGEKLGMLDNDSTLTIFNMKTKKEKVIADNKKYFDFIWKPLK